MGPRPPLMTIKSPVVPIDTEAKLQHFCARVLPVRSASSCLWLRSPSWPSAAAAASTSSARSSPPTTRALPCGCCEKKKNKQCVKGQSEIMDVRGKYDVRKKGLLAKGKETCFPFGKGFAETITLTNFPVPTHCEVKLQRKITSLSPSLETSLSSPFPIFNFSRDLGYSPSPPSPFLTAIGR